MGGEVEGHPTQRALGFITQGTPVPPPFWKSSQQGDRQSACEPSGRESSVIIHDKETSGALARWLSWLEHHPNRPRLWV